MKLLTIDFETHDPYIDRDLGAGWVYAVNKISNCDFEVIGAAIRTHDGARIFSRSKSEIKEIVEGHTHLLMHNASYDIGCLHVLDISTDKHDILDTEIISRLYNSALPSHSLDALSQNYCNIRKNNFVLADAVWEKGLYPWLKKHIKAKEKDPDFERPHPGYSALIKYSKKNMKEIDEVAPEAMAEYALTDVDATYQLFQFFNGKVDMEQAIKYSNLSKLCVEYRTHGVRIDLDKAREVDAKLTPLVAKAYQKCYDIAGEEFNLQSPKEVPEIFDKLGIRYPRTAAGNPSITSPWMEKRNEPICQAIMEARKIKKIHKDFITKMIEMQEYTCPESVPNGNFGRVFPELNLLRARTGRFSCSCPNLQQIPARDPELGSLCRSIFVPEEGEKWFSLDFSNQEGRLQIHYAYVLKCEGAAELKLLFDKDPKFDMHQKVADLAGITRSQAKAINLGLSYGMGLEKLAKQMGISSDQALILRDKYNNLAPFLESLNNKCKLAMKTRGYIKTIGGRKSTIDPPMSVNGKIRTFEYKALNKLIQGSAADQTIECMIEAKKAGINVLFPVHDQLCISGTREDAEKMKEIMENCVKLSVPSVADVDLDGGDSWATAGH